MKEFNNYLICPSCKNNLIFNTTEVYCINIHCIYNKESFICVGDNLVLIDFNSSVLIKENFIFDGGKSVLKRNKLPIVIQNILRRIIYGSGRCTKKNLDIINNKLTRDSKILIIGGGMIGSGMNNFIKTNKSNIVSFDLYNSPNVNFIADAHSIPIKDEIFDLVIIQAVLEHVVNTKLVVSEIERVLKVNGIVYAETPFLQHVHEGAYDFTRYTVLGHRILFENFETMLSGYNGGIGTKFLWSLESLFTGISRSRIIGKIFRLLFFFIRFIDYIIIDKFNEDGACGTFFLGVKRNSKINKTINYSDMIKEYKGAQL